mgnify:CR=1 FL=1
MTTQDVANKLVKWCNEGNEAKCYQELYSPDIVSWEMEAPEGDAMAKCVGMAEVQKKGEWWNENFEVHSSKVSEPTVADGYFTARFEMDTTHKPSGQRSQMSELGVYKVENGKITEERFFYQGAEQQ